MRKTDATCVMGKQKKGDDDIHLISSLPTVLCIGRLNLFRVVIER